MPKVSVIVPIYKAEKTLRKCIDSLLSQTFKDFEILLIDDGSPDMSGIICDEYANRDDRVRAFHKSNGGVSSARQMGIDNARGEYTIHADPDDWVEPTMLQELYDKAITENADMVICDFYENSYKGQKYVKQQPRSQNNEVILGDLFSIIHGSTCNKLIKLICYKKFDICFPKDFNYCEDLYVIAKLVKSNIKISYLNRAFYHYIKNDNNESQSRFYDSETYAKDIAMLYHFVALVKDTNAEKVVGEAFSISIVVRAFYYGNIVFSSMPFKQEFWKYKSLILYSNRPIIEKIFLYMSCCGLYRCMFLIMIYLKKIKHLLQ